MQCAGCKANVSDFIQCTGCKKEIGFCCAGITESSYRKLKPERKSVWKCHACKRDVSPGQAKPMDLDTVVNELRDMKSQLACLPGLVRDIGLLKTELSEIKDSCNFVTAKLDEYSSCLMAVERRVSELEASQEKVTLLTSEVSLLKSDMARSEQLQRANNVEIKGVPVKKNENLFSILDRLCAVVGHRVEKSSINYLSRVPIHNSNEKLIVVSFNNRYIKEDFVASARLKKKVTAEEIGFQANTQSIYLNDHLTPENKKLLTTTKKALKAKGYEFIWVKFCKIHVRKNDNSKVVVINSERDLNKLL